MLQVTHNEGCTYEANGFLHIWQHVLWASLGMVVVGGCSNGYSWGVIFHVNRRWQHVESLLFVKSNVAHIYTWLCLVPVSHTPVSTQSCSDMKVLTFTKNETCCTSSCLNGQCTPTGLSPVSNSASTWFNLSFISADVAMLRAEPPSPQSWISLLTVIQVLWLLDWEKSDD